MYLKCEQCCQYFDDDDVLVRDRAIICRWCEIKSSNAAPPLSDSPLSGEGREPGESSIIEPSKSK